MSFQGKRKSQVDYSENVCYYLFLATIVSAGIYLAFKAINLIIKLWQA